MKWLKGCVFALIGAASLAVILFVAVVIANLYNLGVAVDELNATATAEAELPFSPPPAMAGPE